MEEKKDKRMCTDHSIERANERTRFNGKTAVRFIENGIARGRTAEEFSRDESRYLVKLARGNCIAKAYNGYCLIISDSGICVTVYKLPEWFGKKRYYDGKKRIRNVKKYSGSRMNSAEKARVQ